MQGAIQDNAALVSLVGGLGRRMQRSHRCCRPDYEVRVGLQLDWRYRAESGTPFLHRTTRTTLHIQRGRASQAAGGAAGPDGPGSHSHALAASVAQSAAWAPLPWRYLTRLANRRDGEQVCGNGLHLAGQVLDCTAAGLRGLDAIGRRSGAAICSPFSHRENETTDLRPPARARCSTMRQSPENPRMIR